MIPSSFFIDLYPPPLIFFICFEKSFFIIIVEAHFVVTLTPHLCQPSNPSPVRYVYFRSLFVFLSASLGAKHPDNCRKYSDSVVIYFIFPSVICCSLPSSIYSLHQCTPHDRFLHFVQPHLPLHVIRIQLHSGIQTVL